MKIKNTFVLLATLAVLFFSCKKSDNKTEDTPEKKPKYLIKTIRLQGGVTYFTDYTYDSKKRVLSSKSGDLRVDYYYNGNDLSYYELLIAPSGFRQTTDFTYADGITSSARVRTYRDNKLNTDVTYNYLVVNGQITEIHHDMYVDTYGYDSRGNINKIYFDEFKITSNYTYDDKSSVFTNGFPKYAVNAEVETLCPNNQISRTGITTTYSYDADGYPTGATAITQVTSSTTETVKYSYTYSEL